jgi:hypothetical protein
MKTFNLLSMIRSKYQVVTKAIPLTVKIRDRLFQPLTMNNILSQGRTTNLAWRIRLTGLFFTFVFRYQKHHGSAATVKWLKASLVSLQKALGQDKLVSLQTLGTAAPFSKTANGFPRIIPASERSRMRKGDVRTIRFWTGLFNLYRVLKVPGILKLETITSEFTGDTVGLEDLQAQVKSGGIPLFFDLLPGFDNIRKRDLSPKGFVLSRSASPSNKMSARGILTDIYLLNHSAPELWQEILYYLFAVNPKVSDFITDLQTGYDLVTRLRSFDAVELLGVKTGKALFQGDALMTKSSIRAHGHGPGLGLSQFAIKEEAAGKIRLFALLDSITQSVMKPLHMALFSLLRIIPNDGTFDQEASIRRSQAKAVEANRAYSFDLTAATDRLPAVLTALLFELIFAKDGMAESWLGVMVKRDFGFSDPVAKKLKVPNNPIRYAVGQPMGGLSSWAGLAITHHWIVQVAAFRATGLLRWNTDYEILGDDLVIFNKAIADEYLKLMNLLGCEINLTKSIVSHNRPVFEFAKRTCWGFDIVSGISMNQVLAGWNVGGRVANCLQFASAGLLTKPSLLATVLSRYAWSNGKSAVSFVKNNTKGQRLFALSILSLFGTLYQRGIVPLKVLMIALVNPSYSDADFSGEAIGLPLRASLETGYHALNSQTVLENPFSKMEAREEVFDEYSSELTATMLQSALKKAQLLAGEAERLVQIYAQSLYFPLYYRGDTTPVPMGDYPSELRMLYIQIENFANRLLGLEFAKENPEDLYEEIYKVAYDFAKFGRTTFEEASRYLDRVEGLLFKLTLTDPVPPGKTILESAPILSILRNMDPARKVRATYTEGPTYRATYELPTWITPVAEL